MAKLLGFISDYRRIELPVKNVVAAEFFIQMVNATFMNILPLYLTRKGFSDKEIALFITCRFIGVFALAFPLGRFIKGRKVFPLFLLSSLCIPVFGVLIVLSVALQLKWLSVLALLLWGAWSFGGIVSGLVIAVLDFMHPGFFDEEFILLLFSVAGFGGLLFLYRVRGFREVVEEKISEKPGSSPITRTNWGLVLKALCPTLIIATGAGLTIPFISLFFDKVHHLTKGGFSVLSFIASLLVAYLAMLVPRIKKKIGYKIAIPTTQSLAVVALVALATTQFYNQYTIALLIASACYLLRQPLMNMAGPMTSELVLNYVGRNNREITSALTSAIWSGSWVISGLLVSLLLSYHVSFGNIFLITSLLYAFGIILYYLLILDYDKREKQGLIEE
jgi:MFS family permease